MILIYFIAVLLDLKGIAVSAGAACDSRNTQVSHVLKAIRLPVRQAKGVIRISLGAENTLEDVRRIVDAMRYADGGRREVAAPPRWRLSQVVRIWYTIRQRRKT